MRGAIAHLKNAKVTATRPIDEIFGLLKRAEIDAFALSTTAQRHGNADSRHPRAGRTFKQTVTAGSQCRPIVRTRWRRVKFLNEAIGQRTLARPMTITA